MMAVCGLCFHRCALKEGQTGLCRARGNRGGKIIPLGYGRLTALALDPIEKKPLYHFHPGSSILSLGSFGCNLRCCFCQNHSISMAGEECDTVYIAPEELAEKAASLKARGNIGLAYTYNEPLVNYEYIRDCAELIRRRGMLNVLVTNGTIEEQPWRGLLPLIDGANIDLKGFTEGWYARLGGSLAAAKRSIELAAGACHLEVTTLIIPGENDSSAEISALAGWLAGISPDIPLHLSRYFPRYRAKQPPTPLDTMRVLAEAAGERLNRVYLGNC